MHSALRYLLSVSALATAGTAQAQESPPADEPEIVVTGKNGLDKQVREFVGALAQGSARGQLARFELEVCPVTVGLSPAHDAAVSERMKRVANEVGMAVGRSGCKPNVLVAVVPDKRAFISALRRKQPSLFDGLSAGQTRQLSRPQEPVAAWQIKQLRSSDGTDLVADSAFDIYIHRSTIGGSLITHSARPHFTAAVVVVELEAGRGLTTTQLADYAAMRSFARTDPSRLPATANSILTAIGAPPGTAVPVTLTHWDLGFLKALYSSEDNANAGMRRAEMRTILAEELTGPEKGKTPAN
jgi:hypothetical protein